MGDVKKGLHESLFPVKTDHNGITSGDILVLVLDGFLLLFTTFFSWDFLQRSLPTDYKVLSIAGLWGLDIGMVLWSMVYIFGSTTKGQDAASIGMWTIDFLGVSVTTVVGFLVGRGQAVPELLREVSMYGVIMIILVNIGSGFVYHFTSPQAREKRSFRKMKEELAKDNEQSRLQLTREKMQYEIDREYIEQRELIVRESEKLAQQAVNLAKIDADTREKLHLINQSGGQPNRPTERPAMPERPNFERPTGLSMENANLSRPPVERPSMAEPAGKPPESFKGGNGNGKLPLA